MNDGWHGQSTDGPKGGWSCVLCPSKDTGMDAMVQLSPHPQLLEVVWWSAAVVVVANGVMMRHV